MDPAALLALALSCAPNVHATTASALVHVESGLNPWAIGVVGGALERQPRSRAEALATARELQAQRWNFSVGLGQINVRNFDRLGLSLETAFDACTNLAAMQKVLTECFDSARQRDPTRPAQTALRRALSCYYSGNFTTGFAHGYVQKVLAVASPAVRALPPVQLKEKS
ncbi:MAG: lytic transglycosylase [Oxalobacteraceae bacterium]|nr:MAG: lytic transglycosylase [Oxalobacteraceae bacterium]